MPQDNFLTDRFPLVKKIEANAFEWLSSKRGKDASSTIAKCCVELATSKGDYRDSNQDLAAFFYVSDQTYAHAPLAAVVVADGMGGMRDGDLASALAVSALIAFLSAGKAPVGLKSLLLAATLYANQRVYEELRGSGGTTLSAVLYGKQGIIGLNVGDSRIYAVGQKSLRRLTVDDTLGEQFRHYRGGPLGNESSHDNRLVQFVGMGPVLEPHIIDLGIAGESSQYTHFLLTTDGAHCIGDETIENLLGAGLPTTELASNLVDISRRCGSTDNSSAILSTTRIDFGPLIKPVQEIALDIPGSSFQMLLLRESAEQAEIDRRRNAEPLASAKADAPISDGPSASQIDSIESGPNEPPPNKPTKKPRKRTKRAAPPQDQPILEFIEPKSENSKDNPEDSN